MAAEQGIEPWLPGSKPGVLPLHYSAIKNPPVTFGLRWVTFEFMSDQLFLYIIGPPPETVLGLNRCLYPKDSTTASVLPMGKLVPKHRDRLRAFTDMAVVDHSVAARQICCLRFLNIIILFLLFF